ncbi:MAG: hypothetical protein PHI49_10655 [Halothiobacillaceae bacterium]|jgi:hypothetical protein|nr:hypothetical protein [Halothiobacillaceae bacterium]
MLRWISPVLLALSIGGCGAGETAATAAAAGAAKAQEAQAAQQTLDKVNTSLDAANAQAEQRLREADQ